MGGRGEEMEEDIGGGGWEKGDFSGPGHFVTELPKGKAEMLEEGGKYERRSSAEPAIRLRRPKLQLCNHIWHRAVGRNVNDGSSGL